MIESPFQQTCVCYFVEFNESIRCRCIDTFRELARSCWKGKLELTFKLKSEFEFESKLELKRSRN